MTDRHQDLHLTAEEIAMLEGEFGFAARKAMEILAGLGRIYGASEMIPVTSVQISGVSYDNLGEAGLAFLEAMLQGGAQTRVLTTLNPAGMDIENWQALGIEAKFAERQMRVLDVFSRMGVVTTCTCTPYLSGNLPLFGEHIAWAESSAVCFANSIIGARTNRHGGPSALAAAITGRAPAYGYHLKEARRPSFSVLVNCPLKGTSDFGALGKFVGEQIQATKQGRVPYFQGIDTASLEELKSLCASLATYGGVALFHIQGLTPEAARFSPPAEQISVKAPDLEDSRHSMINASTEEVDFVSLGCPHLTLDELKRIAALLEGKRVTKEFWITTSRPMKQIADRLGLTKIIEASGAKIAADTCCVVAPIKGRFQGLATDSAKACYYAAAKQGFKTLLLPLEDVVREALK